MSKKINNSYTVEQLRNKIAYYINYRLRTKLEVIRKLDSLKASEELKEILIQEFSELGLINDEKFIDFFIKQYIEIKKYSLNRTKLELAKNGFDKFLIQDSMQQYLSQEDYSEETQALIVLEQKYKSYNSFPENNKMLSFLERRGFSYSTAYKVINLFINKNRLD